MGILISLLIAIIIFVMAFWLVDLLPAPFTPGAKNIIKILLILIAIVWLLQEFFHPFGGYYIR